MDKIHTNIGKTKAEIIFELLKTLNIGDCEMYRGDKVDFAIKQYNRLLEEGVIVENGE